MTSSQIFEKAGIERVKKETRYGMLRKLGYFKKSLRQTPLSNTKYFKGRYVANKYMKIDFSKVIFPDESTDRAYGPKDGLYPMGM